MRKRMFIGCGTLSIILLAGCRAATRVAEVPRVDLELSGGNRGYLVGKGPETADAKTTRQMLQTDVEIPSFYKPHHTAAPFNVESMAPPETETEESAGAPAPEHSGPVIYDLYVVKKGESLWTIAAKPEVYGKATRWQRLFDANQDLLKGNPDRLRAGMTLKIPRDGNTGARHAEDEGTALKK